MRHLRWVFVLASCACSADTKAADQQKAAADSAVFRVASPADTANPAPAADSTPVVKKAPVDSRLRDSAVAPRFEMGTDGKVRPIRKP